MFIILYKFSLINPWWVDHMVKIGFKLSNIIIDTLIKLVGKYLPIILCLIILIVTCLLFYVLVLICFYDHSFSDIYDLYMSGPNTSGGPSGGNSGGTPGGNPGGGNPFRNTALGGQHTTSDNNEINKYKKLWDLYLELENKNNAELETTKLTKNEK